MSKRLGGIIGCKNKTSSWHLNRFPMVVTLGQHYNVGGKPTVILYTYMNRHAGIQKKNLDKQKQCSTYNKRKQTLLLIHTFSVLSLQLKKLRLHKKSVIDLSNANPARGHKDVRRSTGHIMGDNPLLKLTGIQTATKTFPDRTARGHRKLIGVKTMSLGTNCSFFCLAEPTGNPIATKSVSAPTPRGHRKLNGVKTMSLGTNCSFLCLAEPTGNPIATKSVPAPTPR